MTRFEASSGKTDISTRPRRRAAVASIVDELSDIHMRECEYLQKIPANLQNGRFYAASDYSVDRLTEAIVALMDAY
jgi:hypothetical protein